MIISPEKFSSQKIKVPKISPKSPQKEALIAAAVDAANAAFL